MIHRKYVASKTLMFWKSKFSKNRCFHEFNFHDQSRSIEFNQSECQFPTTWYFLTCSLRSTSVVNKSEKYRNVPSTFPCLTLQWPFLLTKRVCRLRSDTSWFGKSLETRGLSSVPFVMLYQDIYRVAKIWPNPKKMTQPKKIAWPWRPRTTDRIFSWSNWNWIY